MKDDDVINKKTNAHEGHRQRMQEKIAKYGLRSLALMSCLNIFCGLLSPERILIQ